MRICFLLNDLGLAGGTTVVLEHARQLAEHHEMDVTVVASDNQRDTWEYEQLAGLRLATLGELRADRFDVAIATWWRSAYELLSIPAERHAYFVQSLEDRFYDRFTTERFAATATYSLPVAFITEAHWIRDLLKDFVPGAQVHLVRNGIDKDVFAIPDAVPSVPEGPLRVLVEGHPDVWYKGVPECMEVLGLMTEPHSATLIAPAYEDESFGTALRRVGPLSQRDMAQEYSRHHVLLKMSRVEGVYGPPLEGFHRGATVVTSPVTGHEEYVEHGWNGLVADWDDLRGTARWLDLLSRDREMLQRLRSNALQTARAWPSWRQAGEAMAESLRSVRSAARPDAHRASLSMLGDITAGTLEWRLRSDGLRSGLDEREAEVAHLHAEIHKVVGQVDALHGELIAKGDELGEMFESARWRLGGEMEQIVATRRGRLMRRAFFGRHRRWLARLGRSS